ncbi:MAG: tandem-95 repeat protein [Acidimicrobiia bacterium]|nr:tandem-95 repeat protein [Acidimicrobiia bacterium]
MLPIPAHAGDSPNGDAAVTWPGAFSEYTMADGSSISDVQDNNPDYSDIWGGAGDNLPSTYFESDGTNIFFRVRVRGEPDSKNGGYQSTVFLVSIAVGGTQTAVVGLNGKPSAVDFVYAGNADGSTIREVYTTPFTNDGSGTSAGARWSAAPDEGYFVDFQLPISAITAVAPAVTPTTPIQMFFGSSQAANLSVINKDFMIGSDVSYVGLSTVTLSGAPAGSPPTAGDDAATVVQDGSVLVDVAANDVDVDGDLDPTTAAADSAPTNGSLVNNANGTFTYTPSPGYSGPDSVTYTICDSAGLCDTATVSITVEATGVPPTANGDSATVLEDGSVVVDATANDTDPDGDLDPSSALVATPPSNGTAVANGDGTFSYTPDADFSGPDSFTYTVCDDGGRCDSATVDVAVDAVNDPPVALPDTASVLEDGSVVVNAAANDGDVDGNLDLTSATVTVLPADGVVVANGDGTFTYAPDPDFAGTDSFGYSICDTGGLCDSATVTVTVDPVNDDPTAVPDSVTVPEDSTVVVDVVANDSDLDGDPLTLTGYDSATTAGGTVTCAAGLCTYTPPVDFSGADTFTYTVADGNGGTDTATVSVNVVGINDPPGITDDPVSTDEDTPLVVAVLANDTDPEGDSLNLDFFTQPANGTVSDNGDGTLTYSPDPDFSGTDPFGYRACDDGVPALCAEAVVAVTVDPINDPPVAGPDSVATDEDVPVALDVLANDFDQDADVLAVSAYEAVTTAGGSASCTPLGDCTYTPPPLYSGSDSFTYTVDDGKGGLDTATVTIEVGPVNNRPVAGDDAAGVVEDTPTTLTVASLVGNDTDPDVDPLTITAVTDGAHGTATVVGGDILYTPAPDYNGPDTLTYTVCDPGGLCDTAEIVIAVGPDNDPPVAKDDTATTDEDVPVTVDVLANDADVDGDVLTVTDVPTPPANGTAVINGDNTITYTPAPDFFGVDEFQYEIGDGNGGTTTAWVRFVTVNPVNDPPVAGADAATVDEDASVIIDLLGNDTDIDDPALSVADLGATATGTVIDNGDGTVTYSPDPDYAGADGFTYTVCDSGGLCDTGTVTVTVDPINDAPLMTDDAAVVAEDSSVTVDVLANDSDIDGDSLSVAGVSAPASGTAMLNPDGTVTYAPAPDFFGTDSFTYAATDGTVTVIGTITVTVAAVNDSPAVEDDPATATEDSSVTIDVLANDSDPDGDPLTVVGTSAPAHGTVSINPDGTLTYMPVPDFSGTDSFTYTATDGTASVIGTVTATVTAVNDAPVAEDDPATVAEDSSVTIDVLANDSDVDGDALAVAGVSAPDNGTAVVNPDGTVTYTPEPDFSGTDTFTYTVTDGTDSLTGTVTVAVSEVNDPPNAPGVLALGAAPGDVPPPLPINDPEGDPLTVTLRNGSLPAGLVLNPDGTWSGEALAPGTYAFTVDVCDPAGACSVMVLSISVALLPATGITTTTILRLAAVLLLVGWGLLRQTSRRRLGGRPPRG